MIKTSAIWSFVFGAAAVRGRRRASGHCPETADGGSVLPRPTPSARRTTVWAGVLLGMLLGGLCANADPADSAHVETVRHNGITLTLTFTPGEVMLERDMLLSLALTRAPGIEVELPPLADRLQGFSIVSSFDRERTDNNGMVQQERLVRLSPQIAEEYRLAPMAVSVTHIDGGRPKQQYFATPPIVLPRAPVTDTALEDTLQGGFEPIYVRPSPRIMAFYTALVVLLALAVAMIIYLLRRLKRRLRLLRMSPRERALRELELLLAKELHSAGRFKDFYVEITLIVRRYIERQHHVRAPEQTTEEFLTTIADDPRFQHDVQQQLTQFLEAADLVKFAAWQPDLQSVDKAISTARDYLATDQNSLAPRTNAETDTPGTDAHV